MREPYKIHLVNQLTQLRKLKSYPGWLKTTQTVNLFERWLSSLLIFSVYWNSRGVFDLGFYFEIALCNTRKNKRFPLSQTTKEPVSKGSTLIVLLLCTVRRRKELRWENNKSDKIDLKMHSRTSAGSVLWGTTLKISWINFLNSEKHQIHDFITMLRDS